MQGFDHVIPCAAYLYYNSFFLHLSYSSYILKHVFITCSGNENLASPFFAHQESVYGPNTSSVINISLQLYDHIQDTQSQCSAITISITITITNTPSL